MSASKNTIFAIRCRVYSSRMFSTTLSRISAIVLLLGGVALLFAADVVLPALVPGFPSQGVWVGQLLAAAWLGVAALNWLQQHALLGGIYGRPVVLANVALYVISALSLFRPVVGGTASPALWAALIPAAILGAVYGALMLRGPFDALEGATNQ